MVLVVNPDLSSAEEEKLLTKIKAQIEKEKGKVKKEEALGKKILAYPLKKKTEGFYYLLNLELAGKEVRKLKESFKTEGNILRYLILKEYSPQH